MKDQQGNIITASELILMLTESILANVLAFDEAGIQRKDLKQVVGPDGGTIVGPNAMFQTPVTERLDEPMAKRLFEAYRELVTEYDEGKLPPDRIQRIREKYRVAHKASLIREKQDR